MRCKVLILSTDLSGGGAEYVARLMSDRINQSICILFENKKNICPEKSRLYVIPGSQIDNKLFTLGQNIFRLIYIQFIKIIYRPLITISHLEGPNIANLLRLGGGSRFIFVHNKLSSNYDGSNRFDKLKPLLAKLLYQRAHLVVGVSKEICREITKDYSVSQGCVRHLANPIDIKRITKLAQERFNDDRDSILETRYIVNVASFIEQKNHEFLIEVYSHIIKSQINLKLVLLGDGRKICRIKTICIEKGLVVNDLSKNDFNSDAQVYFLGFQTNPYPFVHNSQLFILTSYWEGLPIAMLEAMLLGKSLVVSDCSSAIRDIMLGNDEDIDWVGQAGAIETNYGFLLQNPRETKNLVNYDLWGEVINTLLINDRHRRKCEKAARAYAQSHDISILEKDWDRIFHQMI